MCVPSSASSKTPCRPAMSPSPVRAMSTVDLARYIGHLAENEQAAQIYQIQFWKRALYPFACLVMVALALRTLSTSSARRSTKPSSASATNSGQASCVTSASGRRVSNALR